MENNKDIFFYDENLPYFELSNFFPCPIKVDGLYWLTSEHLYQAQKFKNQYSKEKIRLAKNAEDAYLLGNSLHEERVEDWENKRVQIMERVVYEKFTQHDFLKQKLLETGDLLIKENSPTDSFWGIGKDGLGKNILGKILMDIRSKFKKLEEAKKLVKPKWMCIEESVEIPTEYGKMIFNVYMDHKGKEHLAIISGNINVNEHVLVRIHSECITGDVFKSSKCDCGIQLDRAFKSIGEETQKGKGGIILYMRDEGRGIGLGNKLRAYKFQQQGFDTIDANKIIQTPVDDRNYVLPAEILKSLGINKVRLITNNPLKIKDLENNGIEVKRVKINSSVTPFNKDYLSVKNNIMGHNIEIDY